MTKHVVSSTFLFSPFSAARWSTLLVAAAVWLVIAVQTRRLDRATVAVVAWLALYEIGWQAVDLAMHPATSATSPSHFFWLASALIAWPLLAYAVGIRPSLFWLTVAAALFIPWIMTGFSYNYAGQPKPFEALPEFWNVASKTSLAIAYLAGSLEPVSMRARSLASLPQRG